MKTITDLMHTAINQLKKELDAQKVPLQNVESVKLKPYADHGMRVKATARVVLHIHSDVSAHDYLLDDQRNGNTVAQ